MIKQTLVGAPRLASILPGYQYRLCPASGSLNEECFREMPLRFVGQQRLRWGGRGGEEIAFDGVYLDQGTVPSGSMWAINPVPINWHLDVIGAGSLKPRCDERADCNPACQEWPCDNGCRCSGESTVHLYKYRSSTSTIRFSSPQRRPNRTSSNIWGVGSVGSTTACACQCVQLQQIRGRFRTTLV